MNRVFFITISSFLGLPPIKELLTNISDEVQITCIHCNVKEFENFFSKKKIIHFSLWNFRTINAFNNQKIYHKIAKYFYLSILFLFSYFFQRSRKETIYTIDLYSIFLSVIFKKKSTKVVYLQYEMIVPQELNRLDKYLLKFLRKKSSKIDLIITPEKHRTAFIRKIFSLSNPSCFLTIPNSNNRFLPTEQTFNNGSKRTIITHIGAIGLNHHIKSYLVAIAELNPNKFEFRFIGLLSSDVVNMIKNFKKSNIICIHQVLHSELEKYYLETDIGIILYKDTSLNHRYCAPNKLYEYWSFGIPVIGDNLPGLKGVFTKPFLGELVDMNNPKEIKNAILKIQKTSNKSIIANFFQTNLRLDIFFRDKFKFIIT